MEGVGDTMNKGDEIFVAVICFICILFGGFIGAFYGLKFGEKCVMNDAHSHGVAEWVAVGDKVEFRWKKVSP